MQNVPSTGSNEDDQELAAHTIMSSKLITIIPLKFNAVPPPYLVKEQQKSVHGSELSTGLLQKSCHPGKLQVTSHCIQIVNGMSHLVSSDMPHLHDEVQRRALTSADIKIDCVTLQK